MGVMSQDVESGLSLLLSAMSSLIPFPHFPSFPGVTGTKQRMRFSSTLTWPTSTLLTLWGLEALGGLSW